MKKVNLVKMMLSVAVAMLVTNGLFAQVHDATGDYAIYNDADAAPNDVEYVTVGATMGYFAQPDPVYHPNYNAGGGWALTTGFSWNWTAPTNPGTAPSFTLPAGSDSNYIQINYPVAGNYVINVAETAPAAYGGCADASPTVMNVTALAAPTAAITGGSVNNPWNTTTAGHAYYICGDAAAEDITVAITETGVPATLASYAYFVQKRVVNIDQSGTEDAATEVISTFIDHTIASKYQTSTVDGGSEVVSTGAMPVVSSKRTKYEFTLMKASDAAAAAAQGIVSAISNKSDYLTVAGGGDVTTYAFTGTVTVDYIVNPAPVTGPIYHVPNTYAY